MSNTIFLDPVPDKEKTIYVQVHDTSSEKIDLKDKIVKGLETQGWRKRRYLGRYFAHPMMQNRRAKRDDYKPSAALVTGHYVP
ncbi:Enterobacterial TraT complement resistance protein [Piscirickettsiaceae bacterium NZ-RLO1]|nr:Enterobacterial TraT complement resistance protein [Piscirickettsiaceae bacterium NZ-RLO1]